MYSVDELSTPVPQIINTDHWFSRKEYREPFFVAALLAVTVLHTLSLLSRPESTYLLTTLQAVIYEAFVFNFYYTNLQLSLSAAQKALLDAIPHDVCTVIKQLDLDLEYTLFACCSMCFAQYLPNLDSPHDLYLHHCMHKPDPGGSVCDNALVRRIEGSTPVSWKLIKTFPLQNLHSWIAGLCSCPGIEEHLVASWKKSAPGSRYHDIMKALII
ncbi:hypothetical protein NM688_g1760 [Phlebia brevispora]|uniref:Uncharacterized protein n=1 Tax=Phlebia brevispora TaxID=194682 RepID=A0ACC1TAA3_9APHY|nr:hypothetical protein NM688_g1760 [Phlebia brevispora]